MSSQVTHFGALSYPLIVDNLLGSNFLDSII